MKDIAVCESLLAKAEHSKITCSVWKELLRLEEWQVYLVETDFPCLQKANLSIWGGGGDPIPRRLVATQNKQNNIKIYFVLHFKI